MTPSLVEFPADVPDTDFFTEVRRAYDAEADPVLRAYLASIARRALVDTHYPQYELKLYYQQKDAPDWSWRWRAEVAAWGDNPQAAFYGRWLATAQTFTDPESARRLAALRRCAETTPVWAAQELDAFWDVSGQE